MVKISLLRELSKGGQSRMTAYRAAVANGAIIFTHDVIEHMRLHRQLQMRDREAGGQLFATFEGGDVLIERATGPRLTDWRSRFSFRPNRFCERREIAMLHKSGLHYVGDWHTHPEPRPTPSETDRESIHETFHRSRHAYAGILMVIVGQDDPPPGLYVAISDGRHLHRLDVERFDKNAA